MSYNSTSLVCPAIQEGKRKVIKRSLGASDKELAQKAMEESSGKSITVEVPSIDTKELLHATSGNVITPMLKWL